MIYSKSCFKVFLAHESHKSKRTAWFWCYVSQTLDSHCDVCLDLIQLSIAQILDGAVSVANEVVGAVTEFQFDLVLSESLIETGDYLDITLPSDYDIEF